MTFYVGQKVVCVDASGGAQDWLKAATTYIVARTGICKGVPGVEVEGVHVCGTYLPDSNCTWFASRFRPLDERQTDISIFTEILDRVNGDKPRVREEV